MGVYAIDETIHESTGGLILALAAFAVVMAGLVYLAGAEQKPEPAGVTAPAPALHRVRSASSAARLDRDPGDPPRFARGLEPAAG